METHILNSLHYIWEWFNSIPPSSWQLFGFLLADSGLVMLSTGLVKKWHWFKYCEKMASHWIAVALGFSSFVVAAASSVIIYGKLNPNFLGTETTTVIGIAYMLYNLGGSAGYKRLKNGLVRFQKIADEINDNPTPPAVKEQPVLPVDPSSPLV